MCRSLAVVMILPALMAGPTPAQPQAAEGQAVKLSRDEKALFDLVNEARKKEKLPPLTLNATLCKAARLHSENMARQEMMKHELDGKGPGQRALDAGYDYRIVRENLGEASGEADAPAPPPADVHQKWMDSKGHKANILHAKVTHMGLSIARSKKGTYYYTQLFAAPRD